MGPKFYARYLPQGVQQCKPPKRGTQYIGFMQTQVLFDVSPCCLVVSNVWKRTMTQFSWSSSPKNVRSSSTELWEHQIFRSMYLCICISKLVGIICGELSKVNEGRMKDRNLTSSMIKVSASLFPVHTLWYIFNVRCASVLRATDCSPPPLFL